ncbi:MAG TPA: His/Gly/Thr/Pro-type tRNA ligase C-terminal domain-containing protein [Candidatus Paceibacterota bacterium]|nr:His/Gly/Thr/Pro-type tRNA ligase C-terminal domain-containing protein [Candidatus Paceibacterota bacterium]
MNNKNKKPQDSKFIPYDHLDKIGEASIYYGFSPTKSPVITKADLDAAKDIMEGDHIDDESEKHGRLPLHAEEKIAIIRSYHEAGWHAQPQPVMLYFKDPFRNSIKKTGYHRYADLEIIGSSGSIAEATLIQTTRAMLAEEGYTETAVEINSIGDRDSIARFARELTAYYRKHINEMTPEARQILKRDPFELLSWHDESCAELNAKAPRSMDFLSEGSRRHLEEILEYCETLGIPYTVNNSLIGNRKYCTETIIAIINTSTNKKDQRLLAVGVRYNGLAKRLNMKRDVQGVGMSILIKESDPSLRKTVTKMKRPIASFVQLGMESKLVALNVVEQLRQVKIPLYLCLAKDRLTAQVSANEKFHMPYTIVMGKKEAVEKTAIVRNTDTHAQSVIPLDELSKYMKKIEADYWG